MVADPVQQTAMQDKYGEVLKLTPLAIKQTVMQTLQSPPKIEVKSSNMVIEIPKPTDLTLFISMEPQYLAKVLQYFGMHSYMDILERLSRIAEELNMGFINAYDEENRELVVNIHKKDGIDYSGSQISPEDREFIQAFERETM